MIDFSVLEEPHSSLVDDLATRRRFEKFFQKGDGCWIWQGATRPHRKGGEYGVFSFEGNMWCAHHISWRLYKGVLSRKLQVLHYCDVGLCVCPEHFFEGTQRDNILDMWAKGRRKK